MKTALFFVAAALSLSGCGAGVAPILPTYGPAYIKHEQLSLIKNGKTTRAEMETTFGPPDHVMENPDRWVYIMYRHQGWGIIYGAGVGLPDAELASWESKSERDWYYTILEVEFDENDVVEERYVDSLKFGECTERGICWSECGICGTENGVGVAGPTPSVENQ